MCKEGKMTVKKLHMMQGLVSNDTVSQFSQTQSRLDMV